jgi:hypothetical protein
LPAIMPGQIGEEETIMKTNIITAGLFALALTPAVALAHPAGGADEGEAIAIDACTTFNEYGPTELIAVVEDGMGDYLVWLEDADEDLWACNANADGDIYANVIVADDLLEGEGPAMVHLVNGAATRHPAKQAERLCLAVAEGEAELVATVEDGLGDYLVWLAVDEETFIMCNASSDGLLYAFEEVSMPINEAPELDPATADIEETPVRPVITAPSRPNQFG